MKFENAKLGRRVLITKPASPCYHEFAIVNTIFDSVIVLHLEGKPNTSLFWFKGDECFAGEVP